MLNSIADGVFVTDTTGRLVAVNPKGLEILGARDLAEVNASPPNSFHFPEVRDEDGNIIPPEYRPFARALAGEAVVHQLELVYGVERRRAVLRTTTAPVRDRDGTIIGAVKTATDVTREYELDRLKDDFVRVAAHELKTPITVIKANAQATMTVIHDLPADARRLLEAMVRGVDRIDRLVGSLLDLMELQGGIVRLSVAPLRLDEQLGDVIDHLPKTAAARIRIITRTPIEIRGDAPRLRQVVRALLDNALKYSDEQAPVEVSLVQVDHAARLTIADHGVGIPAAKSDRIFEKFFRAHEGTPHDVGGIGVGLFVSKHIVEQHGGRIWFKSVENEGTIFSVELPQ